MPKRKKPPEKPDDQFKRFVKTANEVGAENSEDAVDKVFRGLASVKPTTDSSSTDRPSKRAKKLQ